MKKSLTILLIVLAFLIVGSVVYGQKWAAPTRVDNITSGHGEVIVIFKKGTSIQARSRVLKSVPDAKVEFLDKVDLYYITSNKLTTDELIDYFSRKAEVESVSPNAAIKLYRLPNEPNFQSLWALWNLGQSIDNVSGNVGIDIKALPAWNITTGDNRVTAAIIDSGVDYSHPDLINNIWLAPEDYSVDLGDNHILNCGANTRGIDTFSFDCFPTDQDNAEQNPDYTHGTHVAGIIGAEGGNNQGVVGVNWRSSILPIRASNGLVFNLINAAYGINYILQLKERFGDQANIRVLNASWGLNEDVPALLSLIRNLRDANVLVVAASGNDGHSNDNDPIFPANYSVTESNVISVASIDNRGLRDPQSNYGTVTVSLGAPGVSIYSTIRGGDYRSFSGTSMAAPQVSGAALLILSRCDVDTTTLKSLILNNTDPTPSLVGKTVTGGRLNVYRSLLACASEPTPTAYNVKFFPSNVIGLIDINDNGQVLGATANTNSAGVVYDNASGFNFLPPHPSGEHAKLSSMNKFGWVTGDFLYTPQTGMQLLVPPPGYDMPLGRGINDAGQIVGDMRRELGFDPFLRDTNGQFNVIEPLAEISATPIDINNNGQIAGMAYFKEGRRAFVYDIATESISVIPVPDGFEPDSMDVAAINDNDVVVGFILPTGTNTTVGFWYSAATGTIPITAPGLESTLMDVNNSGQAVGYTTTGPFQDRAIIYDRINGLRYLDSMISDSDPSRATKINNSGQITMEFGFACPPPCIPPFPFKLALLTPSQSTGIGSNLTIQSGSVAVSYSNVTSPGETFVSPLPVPPASMLPQNYLLTENSLAYDLETTASFTGSNRVCSTLPSIGDAMTFNRMTLLHYENGSYLDRTISRDYSTLEICAAVTSLSPFVVAQAPLSPTAASVTVGGRVMMANGYGIRNARITIADARGNLHVITTGSFGYYRFDNILAGQIYFLTVSARHYAFTNPSVAVNVSDAVENLNFVVSEQ